jgi:putative CocE/NonD family hydrolase
MSLLRRRPRLVVLATVLGALCAAPTAIAADVPPGAKWSEATIDSTDGVKLHADILRPENLSDNEKTPVILSIGPYFNHAGQTGAVGPAQGTSFDPIGPSTGPSDRFLDLVEGGRLMQRGYTFVMVDLRGFGGSTGCLDWAGPGEQADVENAVEWAATRSWSTGKVGMYGKSYDGVTGLIGVNRKPKGLAAVVSQEPVYDLYRYLYGDGMRRLNSAATPALYDAIDATPGPLADDPAYSVNGANDTQRPGCKPANWADQAANEDHFSPYWRKRNLIPGAKGSKVPLFLTQGLTENNTVSDGTAQYLHNHAGYERAWLGPWDHVRGNETDESGRLLMGRAGWFSEVMRFYNRFLKGTTPSVAERRGPDGRCADERRQMAR